MRTSRVSKDTSKLFDRATGSRSPPRRLTRSAIAKFAYTASSSSTTTDVKERIRPQTTDIEDAIAPPARKRRRVSATTATSTTTTTTAATSPSSIIKSEIVDESLSSITSPPPKPKAERRTRKPARKVTNRSTGEVKVEPPSDWEEMYQLVREMRAPGGVAYGAAVDTMGCERLADRSASARDQRFHTLIALMMSSQTKDTVNAVVMRKLQTELPAHKPGAPKGLNLDNILAVDPKLLNEMIWTVGFHNNKTKYIKQAAEILRDEWDGDIPDTIEGLTALPGVGPKMGYLCLSAAWNRTEGIGVDVHVHRITNLWGWNTTRTPEETRAALQSWLPQDRWREINSLLVGLGQAVCLPQGRRCGDCEVGLAGLCRAADRKKLMDGRRVRARVKEEQQEEEEEEHKEHKVLLQGGGAAVNKKEEQSLTEEAIVKQEVISEGIDTKV